MTAVGNGGTTSESAAYDAAGAMTCRALASASCTTPTPSGQTLSYDALRRLVSWQNGSTSSEQYAEDGEGTRVWRQTTSGAWTTTTVAILGLEEVTTSSLGGAPTATRYYALPGGVRATRDRTGLVYEANDQLGTPIAALNLASGITGEQLRAPYGQARYAAAASGGSGGLRTPYGFTGQREDTTPSGSSGLDDFNARMYDPAVGRFTSADDAAQPGLGDPSGQDGYAYVGGRVESATDPSGQMGFDFENRGLGLGFAEKGEVGGAAGIGLIIVNLVDLTVYTAETLFGTAPTTSTPALRPLAPPNTGPVPSPGEVVNQRTDPIHNGTLTGSIEPPPPEPTTTPTTTSATETNPPEAGPQTSTDGAMQGGGGRRCHNNRPTNCRGDRFPKVIDPRTNRQIPFPTNLVKTPKDQRVNWDNYTRGEYIAEWIRRGYPALNWADYDIHHITPREWGGTNDFWNLVPVLRDLHQGPAPDGITAWWDAYGAC